MDKNKAVQLFKIWIEKSALGLNGEKVLLALGVDGEIAGMAIFAINNREGRIGLISALENYRDKALEEL
jgi:hypothetical protein